MDIEYMELLYRLYKVVDNASCQTNRYEEVYKSVFFNGTEFLQKINTAIGHYDRGLLK